MVNSYGITSSPLHGGFPTDRFIAEWHLESPRVRTRCEGQMRESASSFQASLELPLQFKELRREDPAAALEVQLDFREKILNLLRRNLCVTGFELDPVKQRARYYLQSEVPDIPHL